MQRILVNDHLWEVPEGPGWEDVIKEAESMRKLLQECMSQIECRQIVHELRNIFYRHAVSRQYLQQTNENKDELWNSIFKWG